MLGRFRITSLLFSLIVLMLFAGCKNTVTIKYEQPANFYVFDEDPTGTPHNTTGAGNGMFMVYKITSIENTQAGATDFNFKPSKLYASNPNETLLDTSFANNVQLNTAHEQLVAKGKTASNIGRIIIRVDSGSDKTEVINAMKTAWQPLHYASSSGESVLLVQVPPKPTPKFLDPATPTNLP